MKLPNSLPPHVGFPCIARDQTQSLAYGEALKAYYFNITKLSVLGCWQYFVNLDW